MAKFSFMERVGSEVKRAAINKQSTWHTPFMAAAVGAIAERIPLVDVVLDVRDSRIPLSSECELLRNFSGSQHIIVLNKMDLVEQSHLKEWIKYFEGQNYAAHGINSHNKDATQQLLSFLQGQVRALPKMGNARKSITVMLVGIPNVGKSALANALHQVGRISAAEKGKLRYAVVSPLPGETTTISSLKIASHPNIYILDTPGILPLQITDTEVCAKLALTGVFPDCLAGEKELARYCMAILNSSDQYKKWGKPPKSENEFKYSELVKKVYPTDHTQDFIVHDVRKRLFEAITSFKGHLQNEEDMLKLIEMEMEALRNVFCLSKESGDNYKVASKLLNLYRTGRIGQYTLDNIPGELNREYSNDISCNHVGKCFKHSLALSPVNQRRIPSLFHYFCPKFLLLVCKLGFVAARSTIVEQFARSVSKSIIGGVFALIVILYSISGILYLIVDCNLLAIMFIVSEKRIANRSQTDNSKFLYNFNVMDHNIERDLLIGDSTQGDEELFDLGDLKQKFILITWRAFQDIILWLLFF
ncbi:hypothetical protein V2J09_023460 [Rumex salicifolius]